MRVEQREIRERHRGRVILRDSHQLANEQHRTAIRAVGCSCLRLSAEIGEHGIAEAVVHGGVGGVTTQQAQRVTTIPEFANDRCVRRSGFECDAELLPESFWEAAVGHHVEPPTGNALLQPPARHTSITRRRGEERRRRST